MWAENYVTTYMGILRQYGDVIGTQMFGHLHSDEFRVVRGVRRPMLLTGAVSTIFRSNPSFRVVSIVPKSYEVHVCGLLRVHSCCPV